MNLCPFKQIGTMHSVTSLDVLSNLLKFREISLFNQLEKAKADLAKQGKTGYEILMHETSDVMQNLAQAYGERHCFDYCVK